MSYFQALKLLRWLLVQPWLRERVGVLDSPESYTLHLKATSTSWAIQCRAPENLRADLGHHRLPSSSANVRLYSRDDVWGALDAQRMIIHQAADGWRPMTPQARGGQAPLAEPPTDIPGPPLDWDAPVVPALGYRTIGVRSGYDWNLRENCDEVRLDSSASDADSLLEKPSSKPWTNSPAAIPETPLTGHNLELSSAPSQIEATEVSDTDSDSESLLADEATITSETSWCFLTNKSSGVSHVAHTLYAAEPRALAIPFGAGSTHVRPLCGAQVDLDVAAYFCTAWLPTGFEVCKRLGCRTAKPAQSQVRHRVAVPSTPSAASGDQRGCIGRSATGLIGR